MNLKKILTAILTGVFILSPLAPQPAAADGLSDFYKELAELRRGPEELVQTAVDANDEFYTNEVSNINYQWYLPKIEASAAWDSRSDASTVTIAIIDTGIAASHQDLNDGRVVAGYQSFCPTIIDETCPSRIRGEIAASLDSDDNGHGTSVAAVAGAISNNLVGVSGVAWNVKLMPIKVLNKDGVGAATDVAEGIVWAAQHGAQIINLSLGGATIDQSQIITTATDIAVAAGSVVVAAAGNDKAMGSDLDAVPSNPVCSDGQNNNVIGVAATDVNDVKAVFSNYGSTCIDVSAPGVRILTAHFDPATPEQRNVYAYRSGTSFAAPIVSAAVALLKAMNPTWTRVQIQDRIKQTAVNIDNNNLASCAGASCGTKLGAGRISLYRALTATVTPPTTPPPTPVVLVSEGTIIRLAGTTDLYIIEGGKRRLLLTSVAAQRNINTSVVVDLQSDVFNAIPQATPMPPSEGALIKGDSNPTVFIIKDGIKRPMTYFSFTRWKFSFASVQSFPQSFVDSLAADRPLAPPNGTLVRGNVDLTVYLVENDMLHAMNLTAFRNRRLSFKNVNYLPDSEVKLYPIGETYFK